MIGANAASKTSSTKRRLHLPAGRSVDFAGAFSNLGTRLHGYLPAVVAVAFGLLILAASAEFLGPRRPGAVTFIVLVCYLIAAWCGYGPGILATLVLGYGAAYFSKGTLSLDSVNPGGLAIYLGISLVVSAQASNKRRVEALLKSLNAQLDERVRNQTAELEVANARMQDRLAELETLYGKLSVGLCFLDTNLRFVRVNEKFAAISGLRMEAHLDLELRDAVGEPLASTLDRLCRRVLATEEPILDYEIQAPPGAGKHSRYWSVSCSPAQSTKGLFGLQLVLQDITERKQSERELSIANTELRRANEDLEQFAYSASHDLQEPIRTVAIYSQMLVKRFGGELGADGDLFLGYTLGGALRLQTLVKDLRAYTQASASDLEQFDAVDANEAVKQSIADLGAAVKESGARVVADSLPSVPVSRTHLTQLFQNLIGNAIKYRRGDEPVIKIGARGYDPRQWVFFVEDDGIGIEREYQEQVFGLFKRLHPPHLYPGTGIGLALCRRIVERHGGRIWVESELGRGATFFFTLPRA